MKNAWRSLGGGAALLMLLTILAYIPALRGGFIWDDDVYVFHNSTLRSAPGLREIWLKPGATIQYYPLTFTVFWLEYHLWGAQPFGYHLVNVLLHAVNAVLLWRVLGCLEVPGSWWAAALFAVHPVTVESVAWITERKNVLSGLFYFLAILAYIRFRPLASGEAGRGRDWRFCPVVVAMFLCALLSKTVTCTLPAVLGLLVWWKTGRLEKRDALELIPLLIPGAALGLMTAWMEKHHVGAGGAAWSLSFIQRCLVAGRALWFYVGKLVWPRPLAFVYPRWEIDAGAAWQYLFPVAVLAMLVVLWSLRLRIGRGPLVAVLFFAGTLTPALGFFDIYPFRYSFVADHFQYLAGVGLIALVVAGAAVICRRTGRLGNPMGTVAAPAMLFVLGLFTWRQGYAYQNPERLWRDTLAKNPNCWLAHNDLGLLLAQDGRTYEAIAQYEQALRVQSDYEETHFNLGIALEQVGEFNQAVRQFEEALRLEPSHAETHWNLGVALEQLGREEEAIGHYQRALRIKPDYAEASCNLGLALQKTRRPEEAIRYYEQALRVKPDFVEAQYDLGNALLDLGRLPEALGHYEQALRIKPDYAEAHNNMGVALFRLDRIQEAMRHWEQALRIRPDYAEAHYSLGIALVRMNRIQEAIAHWEQALRINPDYADAHYNLGFALELGGRVREAIEHYQQALRIKPGYAEARNRLERLGAVH